MRIGLIGAGSVATLHAKAAAALPGVALSAVCDIDLRAADSVAAQTGATPFTDYRDLLSSGAADAVIVNTPHALHRDMTVDALESGHDVLVEKPMAISLADCDEMIRVAGESGKVLSVGHIQHFLPDKAALARAVGDDAVGTARLVHDQRSTDYRPGSRSAWFLDRELAGGGALMNIGAHCIDRTLWFAGGRAHAVNASLVSRFGVGVETDALVTLDLAGGVAATIWVTSDPPHRLDRVTVVGDDGAVTADPSLGTVLRRDGDTTILHEPGPTDIEEAFRLQLADFVDGIRGASPAVSLEHGRHVVEVILAAYASSAADAWTPTTADGVVSGVVRT